MPKMHNPRIAPFWEKSNTHQREERGEGEKKMMLIIATLFCLQCPRTAHALRSDEFLAALFGPLVLLTVCMLGELYVDLYQECKIMST